MICRISEIITFICLLWNLNKGTRLIEFSSHVNDFEVDKIRCKWCRLELWRCWKRNDGYPVQADLLVMDYSCLGFRFNNELGWVFLNWDIFVWREMNAWIKCENVHKSMQGYPTYAWIIKTAIVTILKVSNESFEVILSLYMIWRLCY